MDALGKKFNVDTAGSHGTILVAKPVDKVEALLAKAMKRGRKLLSAVVFKNGRIEEIHRAADADTVEDRPEPYRDPMGETSRSLAKPEETLPAPPPPKAAVTVAQPTIGCPVPEFERADVRATRVLREFLNEQQLADFERTQSFLVTGADTGHRYVLTSRQAPSDRLARVGGRSVYDVTLGRPVCVHDWTVPAAEELLELALFLGLPAREAYVHSLPQAFV